MDTRAKIVPPEAPPPAQRPLCLAYGWVDVLTADVCRLLSKNRPDGGALVVLIHPDSEDRPSPLTAHDRAQMVAALGCVDQVRVCDPQNAEAAASALNANSVVNIDASHGRNVVREVLERTSR